MNMHTNSNTNWIVDSECNVLYKYNMSKCKFYRDFYSNDITKINNNKIKYDQEINIYLYLLNKQMTLLSSPNTKELSLQYKITNEILLYTFLNEYKNTKNKNNLKLVLNELFCFIDKFKLIKFFHGNLNIGNIFINPLNITFYVIDFTHSKINSIIDSNNKLFMYNWDLFSLYISLKKYLKQDMHLLMYLENLITTYIHKTDLQTLLDNFKKCLN